MINVARVINSPHLSQVIRYHRTTGQWVNGEYIQTKAVPLTCVGIVTVAKPKDLQLLPEGDRLEGAMKFLTTVQLFQTNDKTVSDVVEWRGAKYKILTVTPDIDYGFFRSIGIRLEGDEIG